LLVGVFFFFFDLLSTKDYIYIIYPPNTSILAKRKLKEEVRFICPKHGVSLPKVENKNERGANICLPKGHSLKTIPMKNDSHSKALRKATI